MTGMSALIGYFWSLLPCGASFWAEVRYRGGTLHDAVLLFSSPLDHIDATTYGRSLIALLPTRCLYYDEHVRIKFSSHLFPDLNH